MQCDNENKWFPIYEQARKYQNLLHHKKIELVFISNFDASSGNT